MIVSVAEMQTLEKAAFARGVVPEALLEQAGKQMAAAVLQYFPSPGVVQVFYGKGLNGGDVLVAARELAARAWKVKLSGVFAEEKLEVLTRRKRKEIPASARTEDRPTVILDGVLGVGAKGPLREPVRSAAREMNRLRHEENATIFAADVPTGLNADTGDADVDAVRADFTLAVALVKRGLIADGATNYVGRLCVLPLAELPPISARPLVNTLATLARLRPPRAFDEHKGDFGRVGIIAGARGFTGAAVMSATAALRAGGGLVTLFVTDDIYPIVAGHTPPEIMVTPVQQLSDALERRLDALAIGPGLSLTRRDEILHIISKAEVPLVVDADALNTLAQYIETLSRCHGSRLLTPHPGEMRRLWPEHPATREETVRQFTARYPVTLLLKGARTLIGEKGRPLAYNTTGNPGMASGGMGDVLTGVCATLLAQKLTPFDAARLGAWLCGRAAELAVASGAQSVESLAATDLPAHFGPAFASLRRGDF